MISLRDTVTLATTKLRVRRIRLTVTLIVAGIIFTVLVFGSLTIRGTIHSLTAFMNEGFLNSFLVSIHDAPDYEVTSKPDFIKRVGTIDAARLDAQAKEAKRLGLPFDPKTAPHAVSEISTPDGKKKVADNDNPSTRQAYVELYPSQLAAKTKSATTPYHPHATYEAFSFSPSSYSGSYEFAPIVKDAEVKANKNPGFGPQDSLSAFGTTLTAYDNGLLKPFMLDSTTLDAHPGEPIPAIAPIDAAEKLLGLKPLSNKAKPAERIARLKQVRARAKNLTLEVCYRNSPAVSRRDEATQQANDIISHAGEAGYQKPEVIYATPTGACQPTTVKTDSRTADAKALATKQTQFDEEFGTPKPITRRISFHIVGILPQIGSLQSAADVSGIISSFFTTSLGEGWFISRQAAFTDPDLKAIMTNPYTLAQGSQEFFAEFTDRPSQKRFLDEQTCDLMSGISPSDCAKTGKLFALPYGNPLATIYDTQKDFDKFMRVLLTIIGVLSAIVMMGTIGKIIADSRKETSVFRAVGAKRHEIAQVYLLYTGILATLSFLIAIGIGLAAALYVELHYGPELSARAVLAFNSHNLDKPFHILGFNALDFAKIYLFVLAISLVSTSVPLASNLSRNPVKDMREE
jgi:hypothetical protein